MSRKISLASASLLAAVSAGASPVLAQSLNDIAMNSNLINLAIFVAAIAVVTAITLAFLKKRSEKKFRRKISLKV